ncbi:MULTISPECIES: SDR family oxidoreductase [Nocardia]|nr:MULTISPECIES: SDR family oxidoreductase [Nocardia]
MKVFQIGAAGGVGRRLAQRLADRGDQVTGMHRNPEQGPRPSRRPGRRR